MLYLQCFYSTSQTLTSDISISTKMDMYHYKIDTTTCHTTRAHYSEPTSVCLLLEDAVFRGKAANTNIIVLVRQ